MRITQEEIAQRVGVSQVTVSKVLNKRRDARISPDKRREILTISEAMGYQPRNRTTHNIGYLFKVDYLYVESEVQSLREMQRALSEHGFNLILAEFDEERPEELRQILNAKTVDGIIVSDWPGHINLHNYLPPSVPFVVSADTEGIEPDVDQIVINTFQATRSITNHLMQHGHRRICLVMPAGDIIVHHRARSGFYAAFDDYAIPHSQASLIETNRVEEISPLLDAELIMKQSPTAIVGAEFTRVAVVMNHLQSAGYRVPEDISVASVFNSPGYAWMRPGITSTSASGTSIARYAVNRLLEKMANTNTFPTKSVYSTQLIQRASVTTPKSI